MRSRGNTKQPDFLCNETEAAKYIGMSVEFLRADRMKAKRIPYLKIGRSVRYDQNDLDRFKEACKVSAALDGHKSATADQ